MRAGCEASVDSACNKHMHASCAEISESERDKGPYKFSTTQKIKKGMSPHGDAESRSFTGRGDDDASRGGASGA